MNRRGLPASGICRFVSNTVYSMSHNSDPLLGPASFLYKLGEPGSKVAQYVRLGHPRNVSSEF